ncbi:hypothetical protein GWO43_16285 [candidate division KSB1 bacterium]|nr:hypothetical protein [candidate division KSB1 bacterium]NIR68692.1 hypothetical protein [candidate division KSB1 bacterium]NIS25509.1 hypothetical protein [candidate division KSB1 bacterium]NIT72402.1 hypothetical protein [candidate division KSB1 bacterium]NIU26186.1 hypothetical protein [candidate division KSB1 bacterium]
MKKVSCYSSLILAVLITLPVFSQPQKIEALFYYYNSEASFESLKKNADKVSILAPGGYSVDEDGIVWGSVDSRVLKLARKHNVKIMPLIVNPGFDQEMLHKLLTNDVARKRAIKSMVGECQTHNYLGIQFDFENLNINDKELFTQFYKETAEALHTAGFQLSIAVVHRPEEYPGNTKYLKWLFKNWRAGYDLKALAEHGDFISVMTYSQHTRRTPPGPNAGVPWMTRNIEYFLQHVPPEKLSVGIPVASMHWYTAHDNERYHVNARSWSRSLSYSEAIGIVEQFDAEITWHEEQKVPYTFFENDGVFEYIFFEDARSFQHKFDLVQKYKLRGFSVWVAGVEDPKIWDILDEADLK